VTLSSAPPPCLPNTAQAPQACRKRATNGWHFWLVKEDEDRTHGNLRNEYAARFGLHSGEDGEGDTEQES
jgi:hypothetical protein